MDIHLILYIVAAVCFGLATFNVTLGTISLVPLGLLAWVLTNII